MTLVFSSDFDLSARNTMALRARSRFGIVIDDADQLPALFAQAAEQRLPVRVLGGGSNVVLASDYEGITAIIALLGRQVIADDGDSVVVEAKAGETWNDVVAWTVEQNFGGIENLAGIPGTIGAAPVQNIGAYGAELADVFESLEAYDRHTGETRSFSRDECAFAYRDSVFKHDPDRYVVTAVCLRLPKQWSPNLGFAGLSDLANGDNLTPALVMERVLALRASKLPDWRTHPNAGSFFQNPIIPSAAAAPILGEFPTAPNFPQPDGRLKLSAGWLIEKSGLKGFSLGPAGMSDRHALVVVNHGGAQQSDISALATHVKRTVKARFGIELHEEPVFL